MAWWPKWRRLTEKRLRVIEVLLALYATIVSTFALGWQFLEEFQQRPVIRAECRNATFELHQYSPEVSVGYEVHVANLGSEPASLARVHALISADAEKPHPGRIRARAVADPNNPSLPIRLEQGELKVFRFTTDLTRTKPNQPSGDETFGAPRCFIDLASTIGDRLLETSIAITPVLSTKDLELLRKLRKGEWQIPQERLFPERR